MQHPCVGVALVYTAGILCGLLAAGPVTPWFCLTGGIGVVCLAWARWRGISIWFFIALAGWLNFAWREAILSPYDLRRLHHGDAALVTLRGNLTRTPVLQIKATVATGKPESFHTLAEINVRSWRRSAGWEPAVGTVLVDTPGTLPEDYFAGRQIQVQGLLRAPNRATVPGLFDYPEHLRWRGIYFQLKPEGAQDWQLDTSPGTKPPNRPYADRFVTWARRITAWGLPKEDLELRLLWAMSLGWQTGFTREISEPFMQSGTIHVFAISGFHIVLIANLLVRLFQLIGVPRWWCGPVIIPILWFYTGATGWQSSAVRSTVMMTVIVAGWSLRRPGNLINSLAAAALLILLAEPRQLFQAGFQLSFLVVLSIALLVPPLENWRKRWVRPEPWLPAELRPRWRSWLDYGMEYLCTSTAASVAAWLGSLPIIAGYFNLFTPINLVANLVVIPLSGLALMCNLGSVLCGTWFPALTELFNFCSWFWMHLMVQINHWAVSVPGAFFYIRSPTLLEFGWYYSMLAVVFSGRRRIALSLLGILSLGCAWSLVCRQYETRITVLPAAGGKSLCIQEPRKSLLVDSSSFYGSQVLIKPFLRSQGINGLDQLLITCGDTAHAGGARQLIADFKIREVLTAPQGTRSPVYRALLDWLEAHPQHGQKISAPFRLGPWRVVHPATADRFKNAADGSVVLAGRVGGVNVLLLSELGPGGQAMLSEREPELRADVVFMGLTEKPPDPTWFASLQARRAILIADRPVSARRTEAWRRALSSVAETVICSPDTGGITLILAGGRIRTERGDGLAE